MPAVSDLRVSLVQGATRWHDPVANRDYYGALIAALKGQSDLVVLPETFTSGFSNEAIHHAETMDGPSVAWLREQASALGALCLVWIGIGLKVRSLDLKKWVASIDLTADRVGFLLAHDLQLTTEVIRGTEEASSVPVKERMKDIVLFSVSEEYFALREQLSITVDA